SPPMSRPLPVNWRVIERPLRLHLLARGLLLLGEFCDIIEEPTNQKANNHARHPLDQRKIRVPYLGARV
ncbi:MAG TPA: hypothetical protein VFU22_09820, partial [Roseiflexaceae bacterium]|nr:hypothetical protein [Roseiflexaceae bacterium]